MLAKRYKIPHNKSMKQINRLYTLFACLLFLVAAISISFAAEAPAQFSVEAFTSASQDHATILKLRITPDAEYHFYSREKGETGRPSSISVSPKIADATVRYPAGIKSQDPILTDKTTYLYEGAEDIFITIPDHSITKVKLIASILLCSDVRCTPVHKVLPLDWNNLDLPDAEAQLWWKKYTAIKPIAPDKNTDSNAATGKQNKELAEKLGVQLPSTTETARTVSPSISSSFSSQSEPNALTRQSNKFSEAKSYAPAAPEVIKYEYDFTPRFFLQVLEVSTLSKAILFGLIAGLILNFMPCVLPVISLKLSSLVAAAQITDKAERKKMFRDHNMFFALGILTWFSLLTIILTSFELAWGQLFQNQGLLIGLAILIFVLALSIFDIFPLPMFNLTGRGTENGHDRWSAFSTGLLATLLATPCSGPFLGGVLGWAFLQPVGVLAFIFLSIGVGMALPYIAMAVFPALVGRFPRPGAWTGTLSHIVGFFLMGTVVYLLYVLPTKVLPGMLFILWITAIAAWTWGKFSGLAFSRRRNILVRLTCVALVAFTVTTVFREPPKAKDWQDFTPQTFFSEIHNKRMVVDFTADWCPNCKVLEQTVLTPENRAKWEQKYNVVFVRVDLTKEDAEKQKFLESLGSSSIPVVAIFPTGERANAPIVLRDIFTTSQMEGALRKAFEE